MEEAAHAVEVRRLRRQLADVIEHTEHARRATAGLVVALVGLVGGLCLPWVTRYEAFEVGTGGLEGGVTASLDGWFVLGTSVVAFGEGGWTTLVATLGTLVLAVYVAVLLRNPASPVARTVTVLGWVGAVGLTLTGLALAFGSGDVGPGPLVAAAASLVAALTGRSLRRLRPLADDRPVPTAMSLLDTGAIKATPPPEE